VLAAHLNLQLSSACFASLIRSGTDMDHNKTGGLVSRCSTGREFMRPFKVKSEAGIRRVYQKLSASLEDSFLVYSQTY